MFDNKAEQPLASRLRPERLEEFVGQKHLIGEGKVLRRLIESDHISSMIFWGPPGVGKTTLARIIANRTKATFIDFSAVTSGIKEIKTVMQRAENNRRFGEKTIVFVDEIHRFNKAQQDAFLPFVEKGSIILIGATTENPSFEVNGALLSRCKVFVLQGLKTEDLVELLDRALTDARRFGGQNIRMEGEALTMIANFANGDARSALSTLEMVVLNGEMAADGSVTVTRETLEQCTSKKSLLYDKNGQRFTNELQPRDLLSQAIFEQMEKDGTDFVWEDMRPLGEKTIMQHFPNIYQHCLEEGYDVTKECIPVVPAQHYFMGGIHVDHESKTSMNRLYAVGETSCNGVHGKNRLASNSLLESMVFAERAAVQIEELLPDTDWEQIMDGSPVDEAKYKDLKGLQQHYKDVVLQEIEAEKKRH